MNSEITLIGVNEIQILHGGAGETVSHTVANPMVGPSSDKIPRPSPFDGSLGAKVSLTAFRVV
jgi:hypothetical protein